MRRFRLLRLVDHSGVSGPPAGGPAMHVAEGVEFSNGSVCMYWYHRIEEYRAHAVWPSLEAVLAVHGHGGDTVVDWIDEEAS